MMNPINRADGLEKTLKAKATPAAQNKARNNGNSKHTKGSKSSCSPPSTNNDEPIQYKDAINQPQEDRPTYNAACRAVRAFTAK